MAQPGTPELPSYTAICGKESQASAVAPPSMHPNPNKDDDGEIARLQTIIAKQGEIIAKQGELIGMLSKSGARGAPVATNAEVIPSPTEILSPSTPGDHGSPYTSMIFETEDKTKVVFMHYALTYMPEETRLSDEMLKIGADGRIMKAGRVRLALHHKFDDNYTGWKLFVSEDTRVYRLKFVGKEYAESSMYAGILLVNTCLFIDLDGKVVTKRSLAPGGSSAMSAFWMQGGAAGPVGARPGTMGTRLHDGVSGLEKVMSHRRDDGVANDPTERTRSPRATPSDTEDCDDTVLCRQETGPMRALPQNPIIKPSDMQETMTDADSPFELFSSPDGEQ